MKLSKILLQKVSFSFFLFISWWLMTLTEAFIDFTGTPEFKEIAKRKDSQGGKYRIYLKRFREGKLKAGAIVELLIRNGYEVKAKRASKKK